MKFVQHVDFEMWKKIHAQNVKELRKKSQWIVSINQCEIGFYVE